MSLARLALRLATIEALRPTSSIAGNGPWPTLAGIRVFDSRLDPIEDLGDLGPGEDCPVVCVYTNEDEGKAAQARGGPPFFDTVDLEFEISIVVKVPSDADPTVYVVGEPLTDPELEASLDFLEAQIRFVLLYGPTGEIWRHISKSRVHAPHSAPHRSSEEGARLAKRTMKWRVEIRDDCWDPAPATTPTGNAVLPNPLQWLAGQLASGSYGAKIIAGLAAEPTAPVMPLAVPLDTVTLTETVVAPGGVSPAPIVAEVDNLNS